MSDRKFPKSWDGWFPNDRDVWREDSEMRPKPWSLRACVMDLRCMVSARETIPGRVVLQRRWGITRRRTVRILDEPHRWDPDVEPGLIRQRDGGVTEAGHSDEDEAPQSDEKVTEAGRERDGGVTLGLYDQLPRARVVENDNDTDTFHEPPIVPRPETVLPPWVDAWLETSRTAKRYRRAKPPNVRPEELLRAIFRSLGIVKGKPQESISEGPGKPVLRAWRRLGFHSLIVPDGPLVLLVPPGTSLIGDVSLLKLGAMECTWGFFHLIFRDGGTVPNDKARLPSSVLRLDSRNTGLSIEERLSVVWEWHEAGRPLKRGGAPTLTEAARQGLDEMTDERKAFVEHLFDDDNGIGP